MTLKKSLILNLFAVLFCLVCFVSLQGADSSFANKKSAAAKKKAKKQAQKKKRIAHKKRVKAKRRAAQINRTFIPASKNHIMDLSITIPDVQYLNDHESTLAYNRMRATSSKFTRIIVFWNRVAPAAAPRHWNASNHSDSNYSWWDTDRQVNNARKAGLIPLLQIHGVPRWAERCTDSRPNICNPNPEEFTKFTIAAVSRYNGIHQPKVRYWQPWNEPNLHVFFKPQRDGQGNPVSPYLYRDLLSRFSFIVKNIDPTNRVVAGGLAPLGGKESVKNLDFARRVLCMQGRANPKPEPGCNSKVVFDIWTTNPYTTGGPTRRAKHPDDMQMGNLRDLTRLINAAKRHGKIVSSQKKIPIWITEFSWDTKPEDPNGLPINIHARWVSEAVFRAWDAGITNFFWFSLRDWELKPGQKHSDNLESGLWSRGATIQQDRPKRSLRAFEFPFVAFRQAQGIRIWSRTKWARQGVATIQFSPNGRNRWRNIRRMRTNRFGLLSGVIQTPIGRNKKGFVRARFRGLNSVPFSLTPVKDFYHYPFG